MSTTLTDPWLEADKDGFGQVSFDPDPDDLFPDEPNIVIAPNDQLEPEVVTNTIEPEPTPEPIAVVPPEPEGPEVIQNADGTFIEYEKSSKGWKATLDSTAIGGRKEVFYGKTKTEMFNNIAVGKINATKELNKLNRRIKLGEVDDTPIQTIQKVETQVGRRLTADEATEIKLLWDSDPDKALETWFTKRTGRSVDEYGEVANASLDGRTAALDLKMESAARAFIARNPEYYADAAYENYRTLLGYMTKTKLRKVLTASNEQDLAYELTAKGLYTVENLEEAFTEMSEDGLLLKAPAAPRVTPAPIELPVTPVSQERIVRTETRPRAGLGLRTTDASPVRAPEPTPPSAEDINDLSDEELAKLYKATVRAAQSERYPRRK